MSKGVILLSGGLDSLVSLHIALKTIDVTLALCFNYGQKAYEEEYLAAKEISKHFKIELKTLELPFLAELTKNALTDDLNSSFDDFSSVWVPNRNGLFLNVAACFCDKLNLDYVIFGANKEEAQKFSDNSVDFISQADLFFKYSTQIHLKAMAPCQNMNKIEIINYAIDNALPLNLIKSCYNSKKNSNKKHCGECMSCKLLYNGIIKSKNPELIKELF